MRDFRHPTPFCTDDPTGNHSNGEKDPANSISPFVRESDGIDSLINAFSLVSLSLSALIESSFVVRPFLFLFFFL